MSAQDPSGYDSDRDERAAPDIPTAESEAEAVRTANRFDIRRLIGGLFVLYALILIALGIFASHAVKTKAAGININLWTGLGMLLFGALMIFWALARPVQAEPSEKVSGSIQGGPEPGAAA